MTRAPRGSSPTTITRATAVHQLQALDHETSTATVRLLQTDLMTIGIDLNGEDA